MHLTRLCICMLVCGVAAAQDNAGASPKDQKAASDVQAAHERAADRGREIEAMRSGGFRAAASVHGHFLATTDPDTRIMYTLPQLVEASTLVVIGTPERNHCGITPDGHTITTDYDFKIEQVFKGTVSVGDHIRVGLPGGRVQFEDGTVAEVRTPGFQKMVNGNRYVLFLEPRHPLHGEGYLPTGLRQGLLSFSADGNTMISHAAPGEAIFRTANNQPTPLFLKSLRDLTANH